MEAERQGSSGCWLSCGCVCVCGGSTVGTGFPGEREGAGRTYITLACWECAGAAPSLLPGCLIHAPPRPPPPCGSSSSQVRGIKTNISFLENVLRHPEFQAGEATTFFIEKNSRDLFRCE